MKTIEKKSLKVGQYVDRQHVDTLVRNYKQERWSFNTERLGKADSLSVWYSVEELEEYLEYIKTYGADGVRFYFGAYPENFEKIPEYAGRQTMVLVGTKHMEEGERQTNKDLYIRDGRESKLLAYNVGSLCPPWCGSPTTTPPTGKADLGVTLIDNGEGKMTVV